MLSRKGFYIHAVGTILEGGMKMWVDGGYPILSSHRLNIKESNNVSKLISEGYHFIDVRTQGEHEANSAKNAINIPLNEIYKHLNEMDRSKKYIAFCTSGYRSVLAVSILRANGFNAIDIYGGFAAISVYASDLTTTGQTCPSLKAMITKMETSS